VYLELEAMALTRDIPASLAWVIAPAVSHLSINSLTTTLRQTRDAVISSGVVSKKWHLVRFRLAAPAH